MALTYLDNAYSGIVEGETIATYKVGSGGRTVRNFTGTAGAIVAKAAELQAQGYETEITTGPQYKLTATLSIDIISNPDEQADPVPKWQLIPHEYTQGILECQRPFTVGLDASARQGVEAKLKNPNKYTLDFVKYDPSTMSEAYWHTLQNAAARIYHYKTMGVEGRLTQTLILKRSIEVPTTYNLTWSTANSDFVMSTGHLISSADVPDNIADVLPASGDATETVFVDGYFADVAGQMVIPFYKGWLQHWPIIETVGSDRVLISQEWHYNKWLVGDNGLYDVIT